MDCVPHTTCKTGVLVIDNLILRRDLNLVAADNASLVAVRQLAWLVICTAQCKLLYGGVRVH
jgi:hypothetical protein